MTRPLTCVAVLALLASSSPTAQSLSAEESLTATHQTLMQAVTAANADRVAALIHPRALGFFRNSMQIVELQPGAALSGTVQGLLSDLGEFTRSDTSLAATVRVAGDTGIVTQTSMRDAKSAKGKMVRHYLRTTAVYVRTAEGWKLISWHTSDIPLEK